MPRKYAKKARKPRARPAPRRRMRRTRHSTIARNAGFASGMPHVRRARLRWVQDVDVTPTSALIVSSYSATNARVPKAATHSPMGWDQWAALYQRFTVVGSKINLRVLGDYEGSTASSPTAIGIFTSEDSSTSVYTSYTDFIEAKKGVYRLVSGSQMKSVSLTVPFSTKRFFNVKDVKDVDDLGALITGSPTREAFFDVWYQGLATNHGLIRIVVTIDYIVDFQGPKDIVPS